MKGKCILCKNNISNSILLSFNNMPASAQNIPSKDELITDKSITLNLCQCNKCGLVQLDVTPVDYYKKVIRAGGGSSTMINLRNEEYKLFIEKFNLKGKKIIEIGCGAGEFLKCWKNFDVHAIGLEYDQGLTQKAKELGLEVYQGYADDANYTIPGAPFDAFTQFNFLEHQPNPNEMLQCIYNNLTPNGVGLVTVPSLEYILKYDGYYELIRDHIAYYSEQSIRLLFENNGFDIVSIRTVNRDTHELMVRKRLSIDISSWSKNFGILSNELKEYIDLYKKENKRLAIWGASHQGFTLIPSLGISEDFEYIIDSAPFKQGRYAPASHIKIVSPEHFYKDPVDTVLIIAPGYTKEISELIRKNVKINIDIRTLRSNHLEKI